MVIYHDLLFSKTITNNMFFFPFEIMQTLSLVMNMCIYIYILLSIILTKLLLFFLKWSDIWNN